MNFYPDSYYNYPKEYKRSMIYKWKSRCVIYEDFDELYDTYMNTMNCSHCDKEFVNSKYRHLDHCHKTGLFRAIVCQRCNTQDSYLKYPPHFTSEDKKKQVDKEYREANRDKRNKKGNCFFCNKHMMIRNLKTHYLNGHCVINQNNM
tara:strand:- start:40 stop:480 length:441 start_codon:yes stop_codon:yes gene_type:complete